MTTALINDEFIFVLQHNLSAKLCMQAHVYIRRQANPRQNCLVIASLQVTFKECDTFDLRVLKGPADYMAAANSTETTEKIEACMKVWIKQIEQVRGYSQGYHPFSELKLAVILHAFYVVQSSLWPGFEREFIFTSVFP